MEDIKTIPIEKLLNSLMTFSSQLATCNLSVALSKTEIMEKIMSEIIIDSIPTQAKQAASIPI